MTDDLVVLVYTSTATGPIGRSELRGMLQGARKRNAWRGVTGMLVYHDGHFMQVLEGPRSGVEALMTKITADQRHAGVFLLLHEPARQRHFPDHWMAYRDMTGDDLPDGFRGLLNDDHTAEDFRGHPSRLYRLIQTFADTVLRRPERPR